MVEIKNELLRIYHADDLLKKYFKILERLSWRYKWVLMHSKDAKILDLNFITECIYNEYSNISSILDASPEKISEDFGIEYALAKRSLSKIEEIKQRDIHQDSFNPRIRGIYYNAREEKDGLSRISDTEKHINKVGELILKSRILSPILGRILHLNNIKIKKARSIQKLVDADSKKQGIKIINNIHRRLRSVIDFEPTVIESNKWIYCLIFDTTESYVRNVLNNRIGTSSENKNHIRQKYNESCVVCGRESNICHHIVPLSHRGRDETDNMVIMCKWCHIQIGHDGNFQNAPFESTEQFWNHIEDKIFTTDIRTEDGYPVLLKIIDEIEPPIETDTGWRSDDNPGQVSLITRTVREYKKMLKSRYVGKPTDDINTEEIVSRKSDWFMYESEVEEYIDLFLLEV